MSAIGCSVSTKNFPEPKKLKITIAESIKIPFNKNDTVIYDSFLGICGNSSKDELNRYYNPQLNKEPYSTILAKNHNEKIWLTKDQLHEVMDSVCSKKTESETVWECFHKNKIDFNLTGKAISNNSVEISENYFLNNKTHRIIKLFKYEKDEWTYEITKNELKEKITSL